MATLVQDVRHVEHEIENVRQGRRLGRNKRQELLEHRIRGSPVNNSRNE